MEAALALLLVLLRVSHGFETHCDGRQDGAQCYGPLGGTVDIQLMDSTSEMPRYQLSKNTLKILDVINNKVISNSIGDRSTLFLSNGTFRVNKLSRKDSSKYSLKTFNSDGKSLGERTLQLFIQAPVSSVLLISECLSQGERRVSCSSERANNPQYSWTLDGHTLTDAELLSGNNETNIITLKQHVSGHLVCSVRNNVSYVYKEQRISTCGFIFINCTSVNGTQISGWVYEANNTLCTQPTKTSVGEDNGAAISDEAWYIRNLPLIGGVLSLLVIFLVVGVAVICAWRKKQNSKPTKKEEEDDQEVFGDVRFVKRQANQAEKKAEVEYGQVKSVKRPRKPEPTKTDSVYANVQKVR
ncbi:T-cell surface antigen CD2-like [Pelmatolapia mariae]|uniref:T-cell surface antigen CD2-like n=1 Tax=Pelmatolapia mariae TaxID=158779 RepID=UPI002FE59166